MRVRALGFVLLLAACRKEEPPAPTQPTEPWPAHESKSDAPTERWAHYVVSDGEVRFELKAKRATPRGVIPLVRGSLRVDLNDLQRLAGTIEVDLGSLRIEEGQTEAERNNTARALGWLNLGTSRPEAERDRRRWAKFTLTRVLRVSAERPYEARVAKVTDAAAPGAGAAAEVRVVDATVQGQLVVNDFRVEKTVVVTAEFVYDGAAEPGEPPRAVVVSTRKPMGVPLAEHDIKPRDALGNLQARENHLLGDYVGRESAVSATLRFRLESGKR